MSISTFKNANEELIISAIDIAILLTPFSNPMIETLEDPTTGDLITLPEHWRSVGLTEKKSGVNIGNETSSTDIESYGESEPTKKIMNKRTGSTDFVMQESNRQALELFHQADYSGIEPSEHGGIVLPGQGRPTMRFYHAILLGYDGTEGAEIYPYWLLPKVSVTKVDNQSTNDDGSITYHPTLTWYKDRNFLTDLVKGGTAYAQGFCGLGWANLVEAAGFGPPAGTALAISTASLPGGTVGTAYSQTLTAAGGNGAKTWSLQTGTLPAGLALNASTGAITGSPTAAGTSNVTVKVTDAALATATKALTIVVSA
ncbi:hypothetical protein BS297_17835 [Rhodococcus erythropolis]|uniref:Uncharacterized protein n=1 Tax=Rhodococcus erythropolis TaxID=1833 RepID=A0A0C2W805_RHOER|nr:hypothetical protein BS297_17835 [Rhodococcus erythropolis]KIM14392.1 hypothetical protein QV65_32430 [Rhodococcus erythropolis]